jgi:hypothetical protein
LSLRGTAVFLEGLIPSKTAGIWWPSIDARDNQEAYLIDEIGLEERPINAAASFEK